MNKPTWKPTWKQVMKLMKELQVEYNLAVFAASYKGSCSCCSTPANFNDEAYLTPEVKKQTWEDIELILSLKIQATPKVRRLLIKTLVMSKTVMSMMASLKPNNIWVTS